MMEYIFFDANLRDRFTQHSNGLGIAYETLEDNMGMIIAVSEDLADDLMASLEELYEELQDEQASLMSKTEGGLNNLAGFSLVLPDGSMTMVPLQPEIANRLLSNFTIDEIQALFSKVARCALDPKERHLCEILHSEANSNV